MTDADGPLTLPEQESSAQLVVFDIGRWTIALAQSRRDWTISKV